MLRQQHVLCNFSRFNTCEDHKIPRVHRHPFLLSIFGFKNERACGENGQERYMHKKRVAQRHSCLHLLKRLTKISRRLFPAWNTGEEVWVVPIQCISVGERSLECLRAGPGMGSVYFRYGSPSVHPSILRVSKIAAFFWMGDIWNAPFWAGGFVYDRARCTDIRRARLRCIWTVNRCI